MKRCRSHLSTLLLSGLLILTPWTLVHGDMADDTAALESDTARHLVAHHAAESSLAAPAAHHDQDDGRGHQDPPATPADCCETGDCQDNCDQCETFSPMAVLLVQRPTIFITWVLTPATVTHSQGLKTGLPPAAPI